MAGGEEGSEWRGLRGFVRRRLLPFTERRDCLDATLAGGENRNPHASERANAHSGPTLVRPHKAARPFATSLPRARRRRARTPPSRVLLAGPLRTPGCGFSIRRSLLRHRSERGEGKRREHASRLFLQLLLHFDERVGALLRAQQTAHRLAQNQRRHPLPAHPHLHASIKIA